MADTSQIREHMEVLGSDEEHVGTVDHLDEDGRVKLTKSDSTDGKHHFIDASLIEHIDEHVHLNVTADEAMEEWDDELELRDDDGTEAAASETRVKDPADIK